MKARSVRKDGEVQRTRFQGSGVSRGLGVAMGGMGVEKSHERRSENWEEGWFAKGMSLGREGPRRDDARPAK